MEKPLNLTLFYTQNIRGDLSLLPRMYSFLQQLRADHAPETRPLLLDLGASCAPEIWHCRVTGGRSTLIVFDAMGYHAANVKGVLAPPQRPKIEEVVRVGLVDAAHAWHYDVPPVQDATLAAVTVPLDDPDLRLQMLLSPADETRIEGKTLHLQGVDSGVVGMAKVDLHGAPSLTAQERFPLPPGTRPNPTIAASVEFVESEARYAQKQQGS